MAYKFDGASAYLELSSALTAAGPVTLCSWFKITSVAAAQDILAICKSTGGFNGFQIVNVGGGTWRASTGDGTTTANADATPLIPKAGLWMFGAGVFAANDRSSQLQSGNRGANTTSVTPSGLDRAIVGARWSSGSRNQFFSGLIAEIGIWQAALTPRELLELYLGARPIDVRPQALICYLPLSQAYGIRDLSPRANVFANNAALPVADHPSLLSPPRRRLWLVSAPSSGRTLSGALAEARDAAAIAARVRVSGSLARSETSDSAAVAAGLRISGAVAISEAKESLAAAARLRDACSGTLADGSEGAVVSARTAIAGAIAAAETNDHCAGHASALVPGIVDPRFLFVPRPRTRWLIAPLRLRGLRAFPKTRHVIAIQQRA